MCFFMSTDVVLKVFSVFFPSKIAAGSEKKTMYKDYVVSDSNFFE